jgi:hypothetical protein
MEVSVYFYNSVTLANLSCASGIKPFCLYALSKDEEYLCPVRAMSEWINASRITQGYMFRKLASGDRPSQTNTPTVSYFKLMFLHLITIL